MTTPIRPPGRFIRGGIAAGLGLLWAVAQSAAAQGAAPSAPAVPGTSTPTPAAQGTATSMTTGQVRRIDAGAGKITLKHEEIRNLEMPPMTMVFQLRDAALLNGLTVGAQVRFQAEKIGGAYVVTAIEVMK